jgi:DeoR family fructose operon transcriptional repressor
VTVDALERLQRIEAEVRRAGRVKVVELAVALAVSEMTIRRDLDLLAEQGAVRRIRGGAVSMGPQPFADRFSRQVRAKDRIAGKLAALVTEGDGGAIGIDASTTLLRLAAQLDGVADLTVVTNGPDTFAALQARAGVTALLTGGRLDARTGSLVGPLATRSAQGLLLRRLFVSAAAVHPVHGTSENTLEDAEVKLALAAVAGEIVVAVDASKLGQRATARGLGPDRVALLVTELDPGDRRLDPYRAAWDLL